MGLVMQGHVYNPFPPARLRDLFEMLDKADLSPEVRAEFAKVRNLVPPPQAQDPGEAT